MRLYGMYFICRKYVQDIKQMEVENKQVNGSKVYFISGWDEKCLVLNELAKIMPLRENVRKMYEAIPVVYRDKSQFDITTSVVNNYIGARKDLVTSMETVISLYEALNTNKTDADISGFDVKLPQFGDIGEFSKCLEDLDFVFKQCPYLKIQGGEIKYGSVDVGSTWITFLITGAAGVTLLANLAKLVDKAIKIKSHCTTVKMQKEMLRGLELKNNIAAEVIDAFDKTNKLITQECVKELENDMGELKDGEEKDKAGRSLEKLGYWIDKGLQIYSAIDAPDEAKDLFPVQEEVSFLSDDLQKLIEMKKNQ